MFKAVIVLERSISTVLSYFEWIHRDLVHLHCESGHALIFVRKLLELRKYLPEKAKLPANFPHLEPILL
jgi:hypothetical protein